MGTARKRMRNARSEAMYSAIRQAFLSQGYDNLTMGQLAAACGLTRRALYHHFSSKEEAFRAQLAWRLDHASDAAVAAASNVLVEGGIAVDAISSALDGRFGTVQRELAQSCRTDELNSQTNRMCRDVDIEATETFRARLTNLLRELHSRGSLSLSSKDDAATIAELLICAICGVNQQLPALSVEQLPMRYRQMCESILFGCTALRGSDSACEITAARAAGMSAEALQFHRAD